MDETLDALMTRARDLQDKEAFAQVVEACHHLLRAVILRDSGDCELADEIAQEALVRAWTKRAQYRPGTSPRAWLLSIARSQLMEYHRRQDRERRHTPDLIRLELMRHRDHDDEEQLRQRRLEALRCCLKDMPVEQRNLLDLVHQQGLTTEEAAGVLGILPAACRQRLSRLQRALRTCTEKRLQEDGE